MIHVLPVYEVGGPSTRSLKADEAPGGELRAVLGCAKQRLRVGVVIAHPGSEYEGLTPSQLSIASTVVALSVEPLSPCKAALTLGHSDPLRCGFIVDPSTRMNNATRWPPKRPLAVE